MITVFIVFEVREHGGVDAYMEGIALEWTYRVDTCGHIPAVEVTADIKGTGRHFLVVEVIRHIRAHFPSLAQSYVSAEGEAMGELHLIVHLLVVKLVSRSVRKRVAD